MTRVDLINTLRQGVPVTARLVKHVLDCLESDRGLEHELKQEQILRKLAVKECFEFEAKNRELDQACRAMLAGDLEAYRMMRKALGES
jgi:hypothetical protein